MRPEKANIVKDLKDQLDASPFLLVADYTGLKVDQFAVLRTRLDAVGAECPARADCADHGRLEEVEDARREAAVAL